MSLIVCFFQGKSFPKAWIWSEATSGSASFAASGGPLNVIGPITVEAFLVGYHNDETGLQLAFHPQDSTVEKVREHMYVCVASCYYDSVAATSSY